MPRTRENDPISELVYRILDTLTSRCMSNAEKAATLRRQVRELAACRPHNELRAIFLRDYTAQLWRCIESFERET